MRFDDLQWPRKDASGLYSATSVKERRVDLPLNGSILVQDVQREAQEIVSPSNGPGCRYIPFLCFPLVLIYSDVLVPERETP